MKKKNKLYCGKTKIVYSTEDPNLLVFKFLDNMSSGDGDRVEDFKHKGIINNKFNNFIMKKLSEKNISTHLEMMLSEKECLVKKLEMIPIEFVIRNRAAGSIIKRLGIKEGIKLNPPVFELFLKNDFMHDPMINDSYCETFKWVSKNNLLQIRELTNEINCILLKIFNTVDLILVDFKIEYGILNGRVILGDELSLDSIRIWDKNTHDKMDKDRFRQNMGGVIEAYKAVSFRLGIELD